MAEITNRRNLIRRTDTTGAVPTINSSSTYVTTEWLDTDIMVGEWFMNSTDSRLWLRDNNGLHELFYTGSTDTFVSLNDTPNAYTNPGEILVINSANTGLDFAAYPTDTNSIVNMTDFFPGEINTGVTDYSIVVDASGSGFTLKEITPYSFTTLSDTPTGFTGFAENLLRVNTATDAVEFVDGSTLYVDLLSNQTIAGEKTFSDDATFGTLGMNNLYFSGITNVNITDITTDSGFTSVNDNTLATTSAIFGYINTLAFGTGATSGVVLVANNQTITGQKTFSSPTTFNEKIYTKDINCSENINMSATSYQYFGDSSTDGSYRIYLNALGDLEIDKLVSGSWVFKGSF